MWWEYLAVYPPEFDTLEELNKWLNKMGKDNWELFHVKHASWWLFKRDVKA
jgi:hypothetical protein